MSEKIAVLVFSVLLFWSLSAASENLKHPNLADSDLCGVMADLDEEGQKALKKIKEKCRAIEEKPPKKGGQIFRMLKRSCKNRNAHACSVLGFTAAKRPGTSSREWSEEDLKWGRTQLLYQEKACKLGFWRGCSGASWAYQHLSCYYANRKIVLLMEGSRAESYVYEKESKIVLGKALAAAARGCDLQRSAGHPPSARSCSLYGQIRRYGAFCR